MSEIKRLFDSGMTAVEIASRLGCSTFPIKKALKEMGLRRPAKRRPGRGIGADNPAWRGGRRVRRDGYVILWTNKGERLEHRVVMESVLNRPLSDSEIVHHINRNKSDNRPENLQLMTQGEHMKLHLPEMHLSRYGQ